MKRPHRHNPWESMPNHDVKPNNVAILIDIENINDVKWVKAVLDGSRRYGQVVVKRAVGNWTSKGEKIQNELTELGVALIHQAPTGKGKNASDVRLVIEAMDLLHNPTVLIDVFVIATSDVDFVPLATRLRSVGTRVIGFGLGHSADLWKKSVDEFTQLDASENQAANSKKKSTSKVPKPLPTKTVTSIRKALTELAIEHPDGVPGAKLHARIRELVPSFDYKKLGFSSFKKLVTSLDFANVPDKPKTGVFRVTKRKSK